jgi:hypothetical protein
MKHHNWLVAGLLLALVGCSTTQTRGQAADEPDPADDDIKSVQTIGQVTEVGDPKPVQISGVGLVYGLDNTGGTPNNEWRQSLEDQLHKQGVQDVNKMLSSPKYAMVFVTAYLPPGVRKGDYLDIEVTLPPGSKATSLRGGKLFDCVLRNYETTRNLNPSAETNSLLPGHILARARGPLLVGFGEGNEEMRLRRGRIWEGGVSLISMPIFLYLKDDQQFASVANKVAVRINAAFPDDPVKQARLQQNKRLLVLDEVTGQLNDKFRTPVTGRGETAHAVNKSMVHVTVPFEYRLCPERYLVVLQHVPLYEAPEAAAKYRQRLHQMLLDPKDTVRAALRLEALGKESISALKKGLASQHALVRFSSAESLTYLGSTAGIEELARLADEHEILRGRCLSAIASQDESLSQTALANMLSSPKPQLRYGAFRALLQINGQHDAVVGEEINDAYWLHRVAPGTEPLVHLSTSRRAEIVLFGDTPKLTPPFRIDFGSEFTLTAEDGDPRCTVSRFVSSSNSPRVVRKQCGYDLEEILRVVADMGGEYAEATDLLRQIDRYKCLPCQVLANALPEAAPMTLLAAAGCNVDQFKENPDFQRAVLAAQQDLALSPRQGEARSPFTTGTLPAVHRAGTE